MSPRTPMFNVLNGGFANAIFTHEGFFCRPTGKLRSNVNHLFWFKFRRPAFLAAHIFRSALLYFVIVAIGACSKEKVLRVAARRIVAAMEYAKVVFDFTICKLPRKAVGKHGFVSPMGRSIPPVVKSQLPHPTAIVTALFNVTPKSLLSRHVSPLSKIPKTRSHPALFSEFDRFHAVNLPHCNSEVNQI